MDAPKCKICGVAHWSNQPHVGLTKGQALVVAKKSTAARKDVHRSKMETAGRKPTNRGGSSSVTDTSGPAGNADQGEAGETSAEVATGPQTQSTSLAGTQAPPVDKASKKRSGTARKASGGPAPRKGIAGPDRAPGISSEGRTAPDLLPVRASKQGAKPAATHSSNAPAGRSALEGGKRLAKKAGHATRPAPKVSAAPDGGSTKKPKLKRGRPSTGFDKKAYQRDLMRDRRAKAKEAKT